MHRAPEVRKKAFTVPFAASVDWYLGTDERCHGLVCSLSTSFFPPRGMDLTLIWFAVLGVLTLILLSMADRQNRGPQDVVA